MDNLLGGENMKRWAIIIIVNLLLVSSVIADVLWEDFEDGNDAGLLRGNWWGGGWNGGQGNAIYNSTESGKDGNYCVEFSYTNDTASSDPTTVLSAAWYAGDPTGSAGPTFWGSTPLTGANINVGTAIKFKFKSNSTAQYKVVLVSRNDQDYDYFEAVFNGSTTWVTQTLTLNTNTFHRGYSGGSTSAGISFQTACSLIRKVEFKSVSGSGSTGQFWVDSCYITGTDYVPGLSPDHITLTTNTLIEDWSGASQNIFGGNNEAFKYNSNDSFTIDGATSYTPIDSVNYTGPSGGSDVACKINYTHAGSGSPNPKVAIKLDFGGKIVNLNKMRYLTFWIKGDGHPVHIILIINNEAELAYNNFGYRIVHSPENWTKYKVPLKAFERENYGNNSEWGTYGSPTNGGGRPYNMPRSYALSNIKAIMFTTKSETYSETGWFAIDNISFETDEKPPLSSAVDHCLVGAYCDGWTGAKMDEFKAIAGKNGGAIAFFNFTNSYSGDVDPFIEACKSRHIVPMVTWEPTVTAPYDDNSILSSIIAGTYDSKIDEFANGMKNEGCTIFLRFAHEMNGNWYSWSRYNADGTIQNNAGDYISAFQHVVTRFKNAGATNVRFVWAPNNFSYPYNKGDNGLIDFWPGSDYVDWIGVSSYTPNDRDCVEYTIDWTLGAVWPEIVSINSNNLPVMISEFAAPGDGTTVKNDPADVNSPQTQPEPHRAEWTTNFYNSLRRYYTNVRAVFWFHANKTGEPDYRVNGGSTSSAQASASNAYRTAIQYGIANAYFTTNLSFISYGSGTPPSIPAENSLVDNFEDGDKIADNFWGSWTNQYGGANGDGSGTLIFNSSGKTNNGLKYTFSVDTGGWGYNNVFLDFKQEINLETLPQSNISFYIKASNNVNIKVVIETPLAASSNSWAHYEYNLGAVSGNWTYYNIPFTSFSWNGGTSGVYALSDALHHCTGIKWEDGTTSENGAIYLDIVRFYGSTNHPSSSDTTPPTKVVLISPTNNTEQTTNKMTFIWNSAADTETGISYYILEIDDTNTFTSIDKSTNIITTNCTTLLANGTWYWRVRAVNGAGSEGTNSNIWSLKITNNDTTPPSKVTLLFPLDNSTNNNSTINFRWNKAIDSGSGVQYYTIEIDNTNTFNSIDKTTNIVATNYSTTLSDGIWYWRVRAVDYAGNSGTNSDVWSVKVDSGIMVDLLVDNFADGDTNALNNWGVWTHQDGGANGDGSGIISITTGITDNGVKYSYISDSGGWSYNNLFLDFKTIRDLTINKISNLGFWIKVDSGSPQLNVIIETPLSAASNTWAHYVYTLNNLSSSWTYYNISFDDFTWNGGTAGVYSLNNALQNCSGIKWEDNTAGGVTRSFILDIVRFYTNKIVMNSSLSEISSFSIRLLQNSIYLSWENPVDTNFDKVIILRKIGENVAIISTNDGVKVYKGKGTSYKDSYQLKSGNYYTYKIFTIDVNGNVSNGVSECIKYLALKKKIFVSYNLYNERRNSETYPKIMVQTDKEEDVKISIYTINGKLIRNLYDNKVWGIKGIEWNLRDNNNNKVAGGIYFAVIEIGKSKKYYRKIFVVY